MPEDTLERLNDLVERAVAFTGSPESRGFYIKSIQGMGQGLFEEALGELRLRCNEGGVGDRARYFTTLLKDWSKEAAAAGAGEEVPERKGGQLINPIDCLRSKVKGREEEGQDKYLQIPFSKNYLQWVRFVNNDFFAISTARSKTGWDKVKTQLKIGQDNIPITLIRGKTDKDEEPSGVLTVTHARIIAAIEHLWVKQGSPHTNYSKSGAVHCWCVGSLREVAKLIGWKAYGGKQQRILKRLILKLDKTGYCFDFESSKELKDMEVKSFGFKFMAEAIPLSYEEAERRETVFKFIFSDAYSRKLLEKEVVSRPLDMLTIGSEIAFKIFQHIYPILSKRGHYEVSLQHLINILSLPTAAWHKFKSQRKQQFQKALKDINGKKLTDGRIIKASISEGLEDFVFTFSLSSAEVNLPCDGVVVDAR